MSSFALEKNALHFLPLGGCGEIGMNLNLYHCQGKWLMVDLGVLFNDSVGIDVLMPDTKGFAPYKKDLVGLVLTHAHEDHIGAVAYLWKHFNCPLYATPFTAEILAHKLREWGVSAPIHEVPLSGSIDLDPFHVTFISLTHSIPEPNALAIRTPLGTVLHTGDWKIDPEPLVGAKTDVEALKKVGDEGVLALVCDSTSVFEEGHSGSELDVQKSLMDVVGQFPGVRVAIACFASNLARLSTCAKVAQKHGRKLVLSGRSLERMEDAARKCGYLDGFPPFLTDAENLPRKEVLLVCTGSQGESRASLSRIAQNKHSKLALDSGDAVIFSSRIIPGNEKSIFNLQNQFAKRGIHVVTHREADMIHVSGHPSRDELIQMYQWTRPKIVVPVHGEDRHLVAHAELAKHQGISQTIAPQNGQIICLSSPEISCVGKMAVGRIGLDGQRLVPWKGMVVNDRLRMSHSGFVQVGLAVTEAGELKDLQISLWGVAESRDMDKLLTGLEDTVSASFEELHLQDRANDERIERVLRLAVTRFISNRRKKKPEVGLQILRV